MHRTLHIILYIILLLTLNAAYMPLPIAATTHADRPMLTVSNLNTRDGLSDARAYSIVETRDGAIWIGTKSGVDRYNGYAVRNYSMPNSQPFSNAADCSYRLTLTPNNQLYAYDNHGNIYLYDTLLHTFRLIHDLAQTASSGILVNEIAIDNDGTLWIATGNGLYRQGVDGRCTQLLRGAFVQHVAFVNGQLLVGSSRGFYLYDPQRHAMSSRIGTESVLCSYYDRRTHHLWIGTFSDGIRVYDLRTRRVVADAAGNVAHLPVRVIRPWTADKTLIGIDGAGVYLHDSTNHTMSLLLNTKGKQDESLRGEGIYDICVDSQRNLWVASYTGGVDMVQQSGGHIAFVQNEYLNPQSIMSNTVNAISQRSDGALCYATDKGVSIVRRPPQTILQTLLDRVVLTLCPLPNGNILAGTYGEGVFLISADGTSRPIYTLENHTLKTNYVYSVFADSAGELWIGCLNGDMAHIEADGNITYLPIREVKCIVESPDHQHIAVGTSHGGYLIERRTHRTTRFFFPTEFSGVDRNYFVNTLIYASPSTILIGTDGGGIYTYDLQKRTIKNLTKADGLPSNYVRALVGDGNRVWISTDRGIAVLNGDKVYCMNVVDGLERAYRSMAALRTAEGYIVFGSVDGAVVLNRSFAQGLSYKAHLRIARVDIEGAKGDSALTAQLSEMTTAGHLRLSHSENTLTIESECINHRYQIDIRYQYYLEGYDRHWSEPTDYPKARYANLPPGSYTLHVKATSRSTGRVLDACTLAVDIAQPWWNTMWAWLVYICLFVCIVRFAWQYYQERLQQRNTQEKIRFFINTAHNIRTPLSLVLAPLADIAADNTLVDKTRGYVDMAVRNGNKLMSMVTELLDFEKSADRNIEAKTQTIDAVMYIGAQADKFRLVAADKHIALHTNITQQPLAVAADIRMLDIVFENLVSNALKYTAAGGSVTFVLREASNMVEILVSDTGIGIPHAEHAKIFSNFFRASNAVNSGEMGSGLGLSLTRQIVHRMKGTLRFESEEGHGTTFILALPKATDKMLDPMGQADNHNDAEPSHTTTATSVDALAADTSQDTSRDTLLFVDDNADLRQYVRMAFGEKYSVVDVESGEAALQYLADGLCDIVVSDVMMPGMQGDELCRHIKQMPELSWLPVVLLTARAGRDFVIDGLQTGADDFVPKPFDSTVLASKIDSILANRRRLADYYMKKSLLMAGANNEQDVTEETPCTTEPEEKAVCQADVDFVERATKVVIDNMADAEFSIEQLCREMAMSRTLFYGRLKTLTGKSPQDFIRLLRLEQAATLLRQGDTVLDVSVKTGFTNVKYFSTVFKKHFGVPPSKY